MHQTIRPFYLLALLLLVFSTNCKKDCDDNTSGPEPCPCEGDACIDQLMSFSYFEVGSWWVYEEQVSGVRDSIYVYEAFAGETQQGARYFTVRMHSELEDYNYYYEFFETVNTPSLTISHCQTQLMHRVKSRPGNYIGTSPVYTVPIILNDFKYVGSGLLSIDSVWLDSGGGVERVYYDVDQCNSEHYEHAGFHVMPERGIVTKTLFDRQEVWNLIEYNIVQ